MNDKIKKLELREDGFLEVQLKRLRDFDDYLFQKIHEDPSCLMCIRDHRSQTHLYYDVKGYITLQEYLAYHVFERGEFLTFLIFIMEDMVRVNASKPITLDIAYVYLSHDGRHLRFLVLPLQEDGWVFQKQETRTLIEEILKEVQMSEDYEAAGMLVQQLKQKDFSLVTVLQKLHELQDRSQIRKPWWQRWLRKEEDPYYIRDLPNVNRYPSILPALDVQENAHIYEEVISEEASHIAKEYEDVPLQQTSRKKSDRKKKVRKSFTAERKHIHPASANMDYEKQAESSVMENLGHEKRAKVSITANMNYEKQAESPSMEKMDHKKQTQASVMANRNHKKQTQASISTKKNHEKHTEASILENQNAAMPEIDYPSTYDPMNEEDPLRVHKNSTSPASSSKLPINRKKDEHSIEAAQDDPQTVVLFTDDTPYLEDCATHKRVFIQTDPFTIGRSPDNDLCLKIPQVSSYHAMISMKEHQLQDLHSSNGTYVNKERIHCHALCNGDHIVFANQAYSYHEYTS